jgi:drug/metabolite transporter superfamily protein YnfA
MKKQLLLIGTIAVYVAVHVAGLGLIGCGDVGGAPPLADDSAVPIDDADPIAADAGTSDPLGDIAISDAVAFVPATDMNLPDTFIDAPPIDSSSLAALSIVVKGQQVPLAPSFSPAHELYEATLPNGDWLGPQGTIAVTATTESSGATLEINGAPAVSGKATAIPLNSQLLWVDVKVTAPGGQVQSYHLTAIMGHNSLQSYVKASNTGKNDGFGTAVAISGNTLVVGVIDEDSAASGVHGDQADNTMQLSGAVYVFVRNGLTWSQQAYLKASNPIQWGRFGWSVAISGDTIIVGAVGESNSTPGINGNQANKFKKDSGAAYVFVRNGTTWSQQAYLKPSTTDANDYFGSAVSISGDTVAVASVHEASSAIGINGDQTNNSKKSAGAAYVFVRKGTTWSQQAYLKAPSVDSADVFGADLAISGDTLVVGMSGDDSAAVGVNGSAFDNSAKNSGAACVFVRSGNNWTQQAFLKASGTEAYDGFGGSVAISANTIVVGADRESSDSVGSNGQESNNSKDLSGAAYVFVRNGTIWSQQAFLKASNPDEFDSFGASVSISGDLVVVGAAREDSAAIGMNGDETDNSSDYSGAAYVFARTGTNWSQQAYIKASNSSEWDAFGWDVAVSNGSVVVGSPREDSAATGINGDQQDDFVSNSGAVYVFR